MAITSLVLRITTSAQVNNGVGSFRHLLVDKLVTVILYEGNPVTVWGVATRLGDCYAEQVLAILDELTAEGTLARFRAGFSNYYASPRVALTEKGPTLRTIISDSLKSLFLSCRYKLISKLKGASKCSRTT